MKRIIPVLVSFLFFFCCFDSIVMAKERNQEYYEFLEATKDAKRITIDEAYSIYKSGKALLISVDRPEYYKSRHIFGSINIPVDELKKTKLNVPKDQTILIYCR